MVVFFAILMTDGEDFVKHDPDSLRRVCIIIQLNGLSMFEVALGWLKEVPAFDHRQVRKNVFILGLLSFQGRSAG